MMGYEGKRMIKLFEWMPSRGEESEMTWKGIYCKSMSMTMAVTMNVHAILISHVVHVACQEHH